MNEPRDRNAVPAPFMVPLQSRFIERLPVRVAALKQAQANGDLDAVARCGHQMRGAAGMYGLPHLGEAAAKVERLAKRGASAGEIESAIASFQRLCVEAAGLI